MGIPGAAWMSGGNEEVTKLLYQVIKLAREGVLGSGRTRPEKPYSGKQE